MRVLAGVALGLLLAGLGGAEGDAGVLPAAGGVHLFPALERSPAAVVAQVIAPHALDREAVAAELQVTLVFRGDLARGTRIPVVWEELARARPVRFADGERVLLALERLPGASIWRGRLPDPEQRAVTWTLAEQGDAFVRDPAVGEIELVEHFLALPPELRDGNPGVAHLVLLAETAQEPLAAAALERLAAVAALDRALDPRSAERFVGVLHREAPRLSAAALGIVSAQRPELLRAPLQAGAPADGSGAALVYDALARLDGELAEPLTRTLLARQDSAPHRAVGARYAAPAAHERLARLLRLDPAPEVRAAAVERLVALRGVDEIDRVLFALEDPEPSVRTRAMLAIADLGAAAVPALQRVVEVGSPEAARTAVGALRAAGPEGVRALTGIAEAHPDESVRTLARIALGGRIGHMH